MDNLAHSLVGLTAAKAGLDRLSPSATSVCILAANAPDIDIVSLIGGRWSFLQNHRGITHSIVGTLALGLLIPTIFWLGDRLIGRLRKRQPRIKYAGLLLASMIAVATHPLMDWTNDYGIRLLLPWSAKWFYGDLMVVVDPYFWLIVGSAAFLLTSERVSKLVAWSALGTVLTAFVFLSPRRSEVAHPEIVITIWLSAVVLLAVARSARLGIRLGRGLACVSLVVVVFYWCALGWGHSRAYREALGIGNQVAARRGERVVRVAALPTAADPFRWRCIVETDRAMYRFVINIVDAQIMPANSDPADSLNAAERLPPGVRRFEEPTGAEEDLVSVASRDPRAQVWLTFARFPFARVRETDCVGETLVQFADLRYTEPGVSRGPFSLDVTVACPRK